MAGDLEAVWKGIPRRTGDPVRLALRSGSPIGRPVYDNGSLRADLDFAERVRRAAAAGDWAAVRREARGWIDYSAKLMRRRDADTDGDLVHGAANGGGVAADRATGTDGPGTTALLCRL